jgi:hypothetical protein
MERRSGSEAERLATMYFKRRVGCALAITALVACEGDHVTDEVPATGEALNAPEAVAVEHAGQGDEVVIDSPQAARQIAAGLGITAHFNEAIRRNADGETTRVYVPETAPSIEVPEGGECGTQDARGAYLSCAPGTVCMQTSEGAPGACVAAPKAPRFDG